MRTSLKRALASGCPFLVIKDLNNSAVALAVFRDPSICRRLVMKNTAHAGMICPFFTQHNPLMGADINSLHRACRFDVLCRGGSIQSPETAAQCTDVRVDVLRHFTRVRWHLSDEQARPEAANVMGILI